MDLLVDWHETGSSGYTDVIPNSLFTADGTRQATHVVRGPKGGEYVAKCNVTNAGSVAELDYRAFPENEQHFEMGVLRLTFGTPTRSGLPTKIEWLSTGDLAYEPAGATSRRVHRPIDALPIYGSDGEPVHSQFTIEGDGSRVLVTLESRGGTIGTPNERNRGYSLGLRLIVQRLGMTRCRLEDALLASRATSLSESMRHVEPDGFTLPLALESLIDEEQLARALQRALGDVGSNRTQGSGNTTRRLQLVVTTPPGLTVAALAPTLASGLTHASISEADIAATSTSLDFDPANEADARKKILTAIARRQGQGKFRNSLRDAYANTCAVTGCAVLQVLEAAHIKGFKGPHTNHVQNGLLLRADIHTLFDMGLVGIDPSNWKVVIHKSIRSGSYAEWHGTPVRLPDKETQRPNETALRQHLHHHGLKY